MCLLQLLKQVMLLFVLFLAVLQAMFRTSLQLVRLSWLSRNGFVRSVNSAGLQRKLRRRGQAVDSCSSQHQAIQESSEMLTLAAA